MNKAQAGNKLKGFMRNLLGCRDIYYINGVMPEIVATKDDGDCADVLVSGMGIESGDTVDIGGVNYRVISNVLRVVPLVKEGEE